MTQADAAEAAVPSARGDGGLSDRLIVETARGLIVKTGVRGLTMRRLSDELGVTLGATYRYVPSKHDLLLRVAQDLYDDVAIPESGSWNQRVKHMMIDVATVVRRHPGMAEFMTTTGEDSTPARLNQALVGILTDAGFTRDGRDAVMAALFFYVTGMSINTERLHRESRRTEVLFENGLDILLDGAEVALRRGRTKGRKGRTGPATARQGSTAQQR